MGVWKIHLHWDDMGWSLSRFTRDIEQELFEKVIALSEKPFFASNGEKEVGRREYHHICEREV